MRRGPSYEYVPMEFYAPPALALSSYDCVHMSYLV